MRLSSWRLSLLRFSQHSDFGVPFVSLLTFGFYSQVLGLFPSFIYNEQTFLYATSISFLFVASSLSSNIFDDVF